MYLSYKDLLKRLFLILRCGENIEKLKKLCDGKKVAVVGNALSLLESKKGEFIDKNDIIIRINRGFMVDKEAQGSKTTVYATSISISENVIMQKFGNVQMVIWLTPKISNMANYSARIKDKLCIYPLLDWWKLKMKIKTRPTSGIMLINYLCKYCKFAELNIYGFDFFASNSLNNDIPLQQLKEGTPHNFDGEKLFVEELVKRQKNIHLC